MVVIKLQAISVSEIHSFLVVLIGVTRSWACEIIKIAGTYVAKLNKILDKTGGGIIV